MESGSHVSEPRVRLTTFDGKNDWQPFWVQFQFLTSNYGWDDSKKLGHLISCLQGAAMGYAAQLPVSIRSNLHSLTDSLARRFCDHVLPETYRANLQSMKRQPREDLYEYADRVKTLMTKAYPGLENTQLYVEMTIEYLVNGLADKNLIYDVLTKKPQTIEEALEMITWHECCKGSEKRTMVRQVMSKAINVEIIWIRKGLSLKLDWNNLEKSYKNNVPMLLPRLLDRVMQVMQEGDMTSSPGDKLFIMLSASSARKLVILPEIAPKGDQTSLLVREMISLGIGETKIQVI